MRRPTSWTLLASLSLAPVGCQNLDPAPATASTESTDDAAEQDPLDIPPPVECDVASQNQYVVDVMRAYYLWNDALPAEVDIGAHESPEDMLAALRIEGDHWSRVSDVTTSDALYMEGKYVGLGFRTLRDDDDNVWVSEVVADSPGSMAGMLRGDLILAVNGITSAELDETNGWSAAYGENVPGVEVTFEIRHLDQTVETVVVTRDWITLITVPVVEVLERPDGSKVGYYMLEKLVEPTMDELEAAFAQFKAAEVDTLVIDARYSSGGLLNVAGRNTSLSIGAAHPGEIAYQFLYNSMLSEMNSTTHMEERDNSLGIERIVVLTTPTTLSATELLINALLPWAEVTLIGTDTGGKPYGMLGGFTFCEKRLYPVTFRIANADGNTDYVDGLPADCWATDDVFHELGDPEEGMLAAALAYLEAGSCASAPMPAPLAPQRLAPQPDPVDELPVALLE
jgi:hypothetical protein